MTRDGWENPGFGCGYIYMNIDMDMGHGHDKKIKGHGIDGVAGARAKDGNGNDNSRSPSKSRCQKNFFFSLRPKIIYDFNTCVFFFPFLLPFFLYHALSSEVKRQRLSKMKKAYPIK